MQPGPRAGPPRSRSARSSPCPRSIAALPNVSGGPVRSGGRRRRDRADRTRNPDARTTRRATVWPSWS